MSKGTGPSFEFFLLLDIAFGTTSILSLTAISLERLYAVKYPTEHFNLTSKPVFIIMACTWVVGIVICTLKFALPTLKAFTIVVLIAAFIIPLVVIIVSYVIIFKTARKLMRPSNQDRNLSRELQVAKTISIIIGLFVLFWMPFFVINMYFVFCDNWYTKEECQENNIKYKWFVHLAKALHYSNSMMNFFVYAVRSPDFRETFKALVFNKCNTVKLRQRLETLTVNYKGFSLRKKSQRDSETKFINQYFNQHKTDYVEADDSESYVLNGSPRILPPLNEEA